MKIKIKTFTNMLNVRKYTALFQEKGLVEVVAFASINKERYFENFGFGENEFNELVNAGTTFGSKFKTIPRFLDQKDIGSCHRLYLVNTNHEYTKIVDQLNTSTFFHNVTIFEEFKYGELTGRMYIHNSCERIFCIIKGFKGPECGSVFPILETCGGHQVDIVNCGTCGVLTRDTITPDVFLLEDGPVTIPVIGLATPSIRSSFSELEELLKSPHAPLGPACAIRFACAIRCACAIHY